MEQNQSHPLHSQQSLVIDSSFRFGWMMLLSLSCHQSNRPVLNFSFSFFWFLSAPCAGRYQGNEATEKTVFVKGVHCCYVLLLSISFYLFDSWYCHNISVLKYVASLQPLNREISTYHIGWFPYRSEHHR